MVTLCADEVPLHSSRGKHTLAVMGVIRTVISEKKSHEDFQRNCMDFTKWATWGFMRDISWEMWTWPCRTPLSCPLEQHAQLQALVFRLVWGGIGCGMLCLLRAQLGWKPVSYRPVLAPEQMVGLWPCINLVKLKDELDHQGREPFKKVRGEKEKETNFKMAIWKKVKWDGCLQSHRTGLFSYSHSSHCLHLRQGFTFDLFTMWCSPSLPSDLFMSMLDAIGQDVLGSASLESSSSIWARFFSLFPRRWHRWHSWDGRTNQVSPLNQVFDLPIFWLTKAGGKGSVFPSSLLLLGRGEGSVWEHLFLARRGVC